MLLLDGQGTANDPLYVGWTQTFGFTTGLSRDVCVESSGLAAGRPSLEEMGFSKTPDPASAVIFDLLTRRVSQPSMRIVFVQAERGSRVEVWELILTDVRFTFLETKVESGGLALDPVSVFARRAEWRYIAVPTPPGSGAPPSPEEQRRVARRIALSAVGPELFTSFYDVCPAR